MAAILILHSQYEVQITPGNQTQNSDHFVHLTSQLCETTGSLIYIPAITVISHRIIMIYTKPSQ